LNNIYYAANKEILFCSKNSKYKRPLVTINVLNQLFWVLTYEFMVPCKKSKHISLKNTAKSQTYFVDLKTSCWKIV
jgi:hypothetical protein